MTSSHFEKTGHFLKDYKENLKGEEDETDRKIYCRT